MLKVEYNKVSHILFLNPMTGPPLLRLFQHGIWEEEIVAVSIIRDGDIKDNIQLLFDKIVEYKDLQRAILELKTKLKY